MLDESNASLPSVSFDNINIINTIHFTPNEIESILKSLKKKTKKQKKKKKQGKQHVQTL